MHFFPCLLAISLCITGLGLTAPSSQTAPISHSTLRPQNSVAIVKFFANDFGKPGHRGSGRRDLAEAVIETLC